MGEELIYNMLNELFKKAKDYDELSEWEFIQTIMREKYSCNMYTSEQIINNDDIYNTVNEQSQELGKFQRQILNENISFLNSLINIGNNVKDFSDKIRIGLITYCYITEMKYWQDVITNILWVLLGKTFYYDPFNATIIEKNLTIDEKNELKQRLNIKDFKNIKQSEKRIKFIAFLCEKTNNEELSKFILKFYDNHLRNTFYHSKYIFSQEGYIGFDKNTTIKIKFNDLAEKIDCCVWFYISLMNVIDYYRESYKETKKIKGRKSTYKNNNFSENYDTIDVMIIANSRIGIVNTMQIWHDNKKDDSVEKEDNGFKDSLIEFMENYDLIKHDDEVV